MNFVFPNVSFLKRTSTLTFSLLVSLAFFAGNLFAAPLLIVTEPAATAVFQADSAGAQPIALGVADKDGILFVAEAPEAAGTLTLSHPDAVAPQSYAFTRGRISGKLTLKMDLKPASLLISALPADEVEIFVNGQHRGRGAVTIGGVKPREKMTIEARSARRGMQSRVVAAAPGEVLPVKFDLRGNDVSDRPDGQIVLPELPLVLASQAGAVVKADGAVVALDEGALRGLEPGERVIEIFLPWRGREVCVYRAAMPARSAILPGSDVVAIPNPVAEKPAEETPDVPAVADPNLGEVLLVIGRNVTVSLGTKNGLKEGGTVSVCFGDSTTPVSVVATGVTPDQSMLRLPDDVPAPKDGEKCRLSVPATPAPAL